MNTYVLYVENDFVMKGTFKEVIEKATKEKKEKNPRSIQILRA